MLRDDHGPVVISSTLLVGFNDDVTATQARAALQQASPGTVLDVDYAGMPNVYRYRTALKDGLEVLAAANALAQRPEVKFAEPSMFRTVRLASVPDDPHFFRQWGLHNTGQNALEGLNDVCCVGSCTGPCWPPCPNICGRIDCDDHPAGTPDFNIDAPEAWDLTSGRSDIIVAVLDTWVQIDHPDLLFDAELQADFTGQPVNECDDHGTIVAGVIGAKPNNGIGGAGVAPSCRVACARIFVPTCVGHEGISSAEWIIAALDWAQEIGARVTNHSYGLTTSATSALTLKFQETRTAGLIHFASVGDTGQPFASYPAHLKGIVNGISGLTSTGFWSEPFGPAGASSCFGPSVDFSAPALLVWSTDVEGDAGTGFYGGETCNDYFFAVGTSVAAPHAASVAALILSVNPALSPAEIEAVMRDSAVDYGEPGWDEFYGWGFVNAFNAVTLAQRTLPVPGDLNGDGHVDGNDLAIMLGAWGACPGCAADINDDGVVDGNDLAIVLGSWG